MNENEIDWEKGSGLVPAIVQDVSSGRVLMLGYMNKEALAATKTSGFVTFYSRSKQRLWQKGETSSNRLRLCDIRLDCDADALLVLAEADGPTCHTGTISCFGDETFAPLGLLADLEKTIRQRKTAAPKESYTASLFASGLSRIAQKVGEEGVEVALSGATGGENLCEESADLLYHLLVLLAANDKKLADVLAVLLARTGK